MNKRQIKSHKGGRTARLDIRLTPAEYQMIKDKASKSKLSKTDLIVNAVRDYQAPENG